MYLEKKSSTQPFSFFFFSNALLENDLNVKDARERERERARASVKENSVRGKVQR